MTRMTTDTFNPVRRSFEQAVDQLVREHNLAVENLTERQLVDLLKQMIAAGDIVRYVVNDPCSAQFQHKQCMIYHPYMEVEQLRKKVQALKSALKEVTTCPTCEGTGKWTPECHACLSGYGTCTCKSDPPETCSQCKGTGREYWDSEQAKACMSEGHD